MVLAERSNDVRNGKRSRGPSPNGHGSPESSSEEDNGKVPLISTAVSWKIWNIFGMNISQLNACGIVHLSQTSRSMSRPVDVIYKSFWCLILFNAGAAVSNFINFTSMLSVFYAFHHLHLPPSTYCSSHHPSFNMKQAVVPFAAEKIRVGRDYQAVCPELEPLEQRRPELISDRALLVWSPTCDISDAKCKCSLSWKILNCIFNCVINCISNFIDLILF